ncbi:uncharacterized protein KY384_001039 [Bacidia gigantensis]|uniref:uncharacterized protein n=1 Tax=Bacidia gigantensis TaxID=2732470 RepID=UPI001D048348|nr:uncharacterized protein KY384_001039 [Bacidia gigantensis]KAG8534195.1 hypothetical protein KY384_001039 [Bacidia gigantensis]
MRKIMSSLLAHRFKTADSAQASEREQPPPHDGEHTKEIRIPASRLPTSNGPFVANYASNNLTLGAGVAIFHLATARVVLCYHSREGYYFLPKGRKDEGEEATKGAEREGYEESGYRNRVLPVPIPHRQPKAHHPVEEMKVPNEAVFATESVWMQLLPVSRRTQYVLFWYIAETVPPEMERELNKRGMESGGAYQPPDKWEKGLTLKQRVNMEVKGYEPVRHEGTGVDEDEKLYVSALIDIEEAIQKLGPQSISGDVVRKGWEAIERRKQMEEV